MHAHSCLITCECPPALLWRAICLISTFIGGCYLEFRLLNKTLRHTLSSCLEPVDFVIEQAFGLLTRT